MLPKHLSVYDGNLWDDRSFESRILRKKYSWYYQQISTGSELCSTLRAGEFTFPGGYRLAFVAQTGEFFCFDCVKHNLWIIINDMRNAHKVGAGDNAVIGCEMIETFGDVSRSCAWCGKDFG